MAASQLRGSPAAPGTRRWPATSGALLLRPAASARLPAASLLASSGGLFAARLATKVRHPRRRPRLDLPLPAPLVHTPLTAMCMKARCTRAPVDHATTPEHTEDEIPKATTVVAPTEEVEIDQGAAPQQKSAIIHDFCLGIPFGGLLFSMGLVGFLFWRSPVSLTFGVAPGLAILALAVLSMKGWRSGKSSLPFILAQAAVAAAVAWKHCQAYTTTKKLLPWGFYAALRAWTVEAIENVCLMMSSR